MATYSYILCSNCGGTGKSNQASCPRCEGARMTGSLVDEHIYRLLDVTVENDADASFGLQQFA